MDDEIKKLLIDVENKKILINDLDLSNMPISHLKFEFENGKFNLMINLIFSKKGTHSKK